jgi:outer membrane protein assembly factor BamB
MRIWLAAVTLMCCRATAGNWPTFAGSAERLGDNASETALINATVPNLSLLWRRELASPTAAQTVYMEQVATVNGTHDEVFQATLNGKIWALNAATGVPDWRVQLPLSQAQAGSCVAAGSGIKGTPTIDPVAGIMYVVDGNGGLHALAIGTGAEQAGYPVQVIDPVNLFNGSFNHSSPTLVGTMLYITTSGSNACENADQPYHGSVIAFDTQTQSVVNTFFAMTGTPGGGGIWGPGGALWDPVTGRLFAGTGNGMGLKVKTPLAESVVALDINANLLDSHSPDKPYVNPLGDVDFASTPTPIDVPGCAPLLSIMNKNGNLFLYLRSNLAAGPVQVMDISNGGGKSAFIGMAAYDPAAQMLFINNPIASRNGAVTNGGVALSISAPSCLLSLAWQTEYGADVFNGSTRATDPVIAGGVVWFTTGAGDSVLAFDELTGAPLWSSGSALPASVRTPVTVADGQMFVQSGGALYAWGLANPSARRLARR